MWKKALSIIFIIVLFVLSTLFLVPHDKEYNVVEVISPLEFKLNDTDFKITDLETFDFHFTQHNKELSKRLNISEIDAFVLGNLAKYWTESLMSGRDVFIKNNTDLIYNKYSYKEKFRYSGYCLKNGEPISEEKFKIRLEDIHKTKYKVLDLNTNKIYNLEDREVQKLTNFLVLKKSHLPYKTKKEYKKKISFSSKTKTTATFTKKLNRGWIKVLFTDFTTKLKPSTKCESDICKEILFNINNAKDSIDIAVYGYSKVPELENALKGAIARGVKVRLVYDMDSKNNNIYENTSDLVKLIPISNNDSKSLHPQYIMHNKFYIFDNKVLITGSANMANTDMSGFNSNCVIVINSPEIAKIYTDEFEQMLNGLFHEQKAKRELLSTFNLYNSEFQIFFSPQDESITNAILPLIRNAKKYIYIPTFVLTNKALSDELISAKKRGVDVKIIIDALNASSKYSKHKLLRENGILVKTENYAGKMHSKSIIIDNEYTIIGSMNFSNSGEKKNDENLIVIKDSGISQFYREFFLYQWNKIDNKWLKRNVRAEGKDSIGSCSDGVDNNYDGLTDMEDPACQ
jgi:phosphatidylserine/phosphatidylglycerophosphate/cardiolipin synthase-like enzyme